MSQESPLSTFDLLKRVSPGTAEIIRRGDTKSEWLQLFPNPEVAINLLETTALLLTRLRQTRAAVFSPENPLSDEDIKEEEKAAKALAHHLLLGISIDNTELRLPQVLDSMPAATDNSSLVAFRHIQKILTILRSEQNPYEAISQAMQIGATGYEKNMPTKELVEKSSQPGQKLLIVTAYSSGVILTALLEAYAQQRNIPLSVENWLLRPFSFDDLLLEQDEMRALRKLGRTVSSRQEGTTQIIRFDDSSQRNDRLQLEGATMRTLLEHLESRYPGVPVFNQAPSKKI
jgi:hypothetical protein